MTKRTIPAISIIIPMYNTEKYIGECLDSILAQTFEDYEVIVVDNCSTDNSAAIVESYIPKFDTDKLQLIRCGINSGSASTPRNIGLKLAVGEYIFFMDSDDAITETALEEIYTSAENFRVDVVHCEKYFKAPGDTVTTNKNFLQLDFKPKAKLLDAAEDIPYNLNERISDFVQREILWTPWSYLIRRTLIAKHDLQFPNVYGTEDFFFGLYILCYAEKLVRLPNVFYVWRRRADSPTHSHLQPVDWIRKRSHVIFAGIEILDEFMNRFDVFKEHVEYKYAVFDLMLRTNLEQVFQMYSQIPAFQFDDLIRSELDKISNKTALAAFLFSRMNIFNVNIIRQQQIIQRQQQQIQQLQAQIQQLQKPQSQKFHLDTEDIFK